MGGDVFPVEADARYVSSFYWGTSRNRPCFRSDIRDRLNILMNVAEAPIDVDSGRIGTHPIRSGAANEVGGPGYWGV